MAATRSDRGHQRRPAVGAHAFRVGAHRSGDLDRAGLTRRDLVIPTYAIVLAVVTSLMTCLLGLLFLLIKEERTTGWLQVTVQGPAFVHTTHVPVIHPGTIVDVYARVDYARSLTATAQR